MTRKIFFLFYFMLNISIVYAQVSQQDADLQAFGNMHMQEEFFEKTKQTILRLYLAGRRTLNPIIVDQVLARAGIKNKAAQKGAHAAFNAVSHIAAHKALDTELPLKKVVAGAVIFSTAEAVKSECNQRLSTLMPRTITTDSFYFTAYERFFVIARLLWNNKMAIEQKLTQLKQAESVVVNKPSNNSSYTHEIHQLHTTGSACINIIIDSLEKKLRKHPEDQSLVNALSAAKSLMQFQQGTLQNLKDMAIIFAKEKIEKQFDDQIDWAIEFIQA